MPAAKKPNSRKKPTTKKVAQPVWKQSKLKRFAPLIAIALVMGGFGVWKLIDTFAATSDTIFIQVTSSNTNEDGLFNVKLNGSKSIIADDDTYDISDDGNWYLKGISATQDDSSSHYFDYAAVSVLDGSIHPYGFKLRRCSDHNAQDTVMKRFAHSTSATDPPTLFYSKTVQKCDGLINLSAEVGKVDSNGENKVKLLKSTKKHIAYYLNDDVSIDNTITVTQVNSKEDSYIGRVIKVNGKTFSYKDSNLSVSKDGNTLLTQEKYGNYYVSKLNGENKKRLKIPGFLINDVTLNYDGSKAAYMKGVDNRQLLYVHDVSKNKSMKVATTAVLKPNHGKKQFFDWSPDGKKIVFEFEDREKKKYEVRIVSANGNGLKTITELDYPNTGFVIPYWR